VIKTENIEDMTTSAPMEKEHRRCIREQVYDFRVQKDKVVEDGARQVLKERKKTKGATFTRG